MPSNLILVVSLIRMQYSIPATTAASFCTATAFHDTFEGMKCRALLQTQPVRRSFAGTVLKLGTKVHHDALLAGIDRLQPTGCFALTEFGTTLDPTSSASQPWSMNT